MFFPLTRETCTREAKQSDSCHMTPSVALPSTFDGRAPRGAYGGADFSGTVHCGGGNG